MYTQCSNSMISDFYQRSNQVKSSIRMCDSFTLSNLHSTFCNSFYGIELYNFNKAPFKKYIQHGVNVCALYFVRLIPLISILFLIKITILWRDLTVDLLIKFIYNILHTNNSTVQSIVLLSTHSHDPC